MSPIAAIGKHQRLRWAPLLLSDWEQGFVTSVHHHTRFFHGAGKNGSPRKFLEGGAPKWPDHPSRRAAADDRSTIPSSDHRPSIDGAPDACVGDSGGITLPPGFCATVFADKLGHARHMAVAPNGVVYVNTWSGRYYHDDTPPPGGFLIALQDTKGDGRADKIVRFGPTKADGNAGGTGV